MQNKNLIITFILLLLLFSQTFVYSWPIPHSGQTKCYDNEKEIPCPKPWDNFSKWFTTQILSNIPKNSVIIMDNASYHNVTIENSFPKANSKKDTFRKWLDNNGIPWSNDMLKVKLYKLCKLF